MTRRCGQPHIEHASCGGDPFSPLIHNLQHLCHHYLFSERGTSSTARADVPDFLKLPKKFILQKKKKKLAGWHYNYKGPLHIWLKKKCKENGYDTHITDNTVPSRVSSGWMSIGVGDIGALMAFFPSSWRSLTATKENKC